MRRILFAFVVLCGVSLGSTIEECIGHCAVFKWGPSRYDLIPTERQAPEPGFWNGIFGTLIFEDYAILADPYQWYDLTGYSGTLPMGPVVEVGWDVFTLRKTLVGGVQFDWYDAGFEGDPNHYHRSTVTAPVVTLDTEGHSKYLWQCEEGISPPYPTEPWPEPAPFYLMGGGVVALALLRRLRR